MADSPVIFDEATVAYDSALVPYDGLQTFVFAPGLVKKIYHPLFGVIQVPVE